MVIIMSKLRMAHANLKSFIKKSLKSKMQIPALGSIFSYELHQLHVIALTHVKKQKAIDTVGSRIKLTKKIRFLE